MPQKVASVQGLHCLQHIQQFFDTSVGSKMDGGGDEVESGGSCAITRYGTDVPRE